MTNSSPLPRVSDLLSPGQVGHYLGVSPKTLANWRARNTGPTYVHVAGRVYYTHQAYETYWLDQIRGAA